MTLWATVVRETRLYWAEVLLKYAYALLPAGPEKDSMLRWLAGYYRAFIVEGRQERQGR